MAKSKKISEDDVRKIDKRIEHENNGKKKVNLGKIISLISKKIKP
jgi:hypothetical protein